MLGILTEKPSAARNFAKALGGMKGTYDGCDYVIVSAAGHLYEYVTPEKQVPEKYSSDYKKWTFENLPWDESLFSWKRCKKSNVSSLLSDIKKNLLGCTEIAIATDVDPSGEGELLAWEILSELKLSNKKISRFYFTDESEKEIRKAFKERKSIKSMYDDDDYRKAEFRTKWDMLSMQFTRVATLCTGNKAVLRQGRLKSAMVSIVAKGLDDVSAYKKKPYYYNAFRDENGVLYKNPDEKRYDKKNDVVCNYHNSDVICDFKTNKSTKPPKLLDLATLSARLSSKGYKAKDVLAVYQKMYEAQVVSYPRTEDAYITPEQFNELLPYIDKIASVVGVDTKYLTHRSPRKSHVKTGCAHGANRPGLNVPNSLDELNKYGKCASDIYQMLARNYLMMLCEDYKYENQVGHLKDYPDFKGSTNIPLDLGFKALYLSDEKEDDLDDTSKGLGNIAIPFVAEGVNPKPPTPTMKWLMKELEKYDVGTGATRTSTYADITNEKAKYPLLFEKKGKLSMSEYGEMSRTLIKGTYIESVKMTENLQEQMREVAKIKDSSISDKYLFMMREYVLHDIDIMKKNASCLGGISVSEVQTKEKYKGNFNGKDISFSRVWGGYRFTDEECERLLNGEEISVKGLKSKTGSTYGVKGRLAELEYNGHKYFGFEKTGFLASDDVPNSWCKHVFTEDEKSLLRAGKSIYCDDFVSKANKKFKATVHFGEQDGRKCIIPEFN